MRAAIYARQSIEKADSVSIEAQIERCKAICAMNGWEYTVYSDVGFSGKNINRPNFERLLADIRAGRIKALVSYKLDRISRSITDFAQLLQLFEKYGVQYISSTEQFDTSSPVGRAMIYIVMVFAQLERETTTQRVADNYRYRASKGLFMGGNVPLGYTSKYISLDGKKASILAVNEIEAQKVREIFSLYLSGSNTHQIARILNGKGAVTSKGKSFTANAVLRILRNLTYCCNTPEVYYYLVSQGYRLLCGIDEFDGRHGMCCYCKSREGKKATPHESRVVTVGRHEPIIGAKDWIAVQKRLDAAKTRQKRPKSSSRSFLAGLLKCAECSHSFGLKYTQKASGEYSYYFCRGRAGQGASTCQNDLWVSTAQLEEKIEQLILERAKNVFARCKEKAQTPVIDNEPLNKLRREYIDYKSRIKNLLDGIGKGNDVIDRHITEYITGLDSKCRSLEAEISRLESAGASAENPIDENYLIDKSHGLCEVFRSADVSVKSRIARAFIKRIRISRDGKVTVEWLI